jgi:prepilin-type N-terminal cleavage/methylation domain-containing protein
MLTGRLRALIRDEGNDAGMTLMELVVAMTLMTIIGAMALGFFLGMNRADTRTVDANIATASARNALQSWTALLRLADSPVQPGSSANRFVELTPTKVVFYADLDNRSSCALSCAERTAPTLVSLSLDGSGADAQLVETRYLDGTPSASADRILVPGAAASSGWLFTPYDSLGVPLNDGTALTTAQLAKIARVDIAFAVQEPSGGSQSFRSSAAITGTIS